MGLIQELSKYLELKYDKEGIINENSELKKTVEELKKENNKLLTRADNQQIAKERAIDEIILCQKRIDALLRQLSEKNGGK